MQLWSTSTGANFEIEQTCYSVTGQSITSSRGKWGKVMTRGKVIFGPTGFNIQMTSFDKEQTLVILLDIF